MQQERVGCFFRWNSFSVQFPGGPGKCLCSLLGRGGWRLGVLNLARCQRRILMQWYPLVLSTWTRDDIQVKSELQGGKWMGG